MHENSILKAPTRDRHAGVARRSLTLVPPLASQDVSRYQARNMPAPTYDLDRKHRSDLLHTIWVPLLVLVATGAAIVLVQLFGTWLSPQS